MKSIFSLILMSFVSSNALALTPTSFSGCWTGTAVSQYRYEDYIDAAHCDQFMVWIGQGTLNKYSVKTECLNLKNPGHSMNALFSRDFSAELQGSDLIYSFRNGEAGYHGVARIKPTASGLTYNYTSVDDDMYREVMSDLKPCP